MRSMRSWRATCVFLGLQACAQRVRRSKWSDNFPTGLSSQLLHFPAIPIADLACGHQHYFVVADDIVEQSLQILDSMRHAGDIGMNRNRHDARIGGAFEIQPVELISTPFQELLGG